MEHLMTVSDPRVVGRTDHKLIDILILTVCAVLSGCSQWTEIREYGLNKRKWLKSFLELPNGIPSHDTMARVFALLDPDAFQKAFYQWVQAVNQLLPREIISIDGKSLNGALREAGRSRSAIGIVSAWASETGVVLAQKKTEFKKEEGEKRATEALLDFLSVRGCIVTLDANGATTRITQKITEKGGDFVIGLKRNQKRLMAYAKIGFEKFSDKIDEYTTQEKGHGRQEKRVYQLLPIGELEISVNKAFGKTKAKWNTLKSFGRVISERTIGSKTQIETRYFFTSLQGEVREFARAARGHWGVENGLHWRMDVQFREDDCRTRVGHAAENLALVRRMTLNMLKKDIGTKGSINIKRLRCGFKDDYAFQILTGRV